MKKLYSVIARVLPLVVCVGLGACSNLTVLDPKGAVGADEKRLILTAAALMLLVVVPAIVLVFVFAWRYRAGNARARYAPEWEGSRRLEAVIWGVPVLIVAALASLAWIYSHSLDPFKPLPSRASPITIQAVSLNWKWLFIYPDQGVASINQIAIPTNVPVDFYLTSDTVMNSFFVPQLGSQVYTMAGMQTQLHLVANAAGTYDGMSANFSGAGFSGMTFQVQATSQDQFDAWLAAAKGSGDRLDSSAYRELEKPTTYNPVRYYSSVAPHLFESILSEYKTGSMPAGS